MLILSSLWLCVKGKMFWSPFPVQVSGPARFTLLSPLLLDPALYFKGESDSLQMTEQDLEHINLENPLSSRQALQAFTVPAAHQGLLIRDKSAV